MSRTTVLALAFLLLLSMTSSLASDEGYDLLFRSDKVELHDHPVYCEKDLPRWLNGTYIRNGPGLFEMGKRRFTHPFDGFAKLHSFKLRGERKMLFSSQFLKTAFYNASVTGGTIAPFCMFDSVEPSFSMWDKFRSYFNGVDNTNVNVFRFPGRHATGKSHFVAVSDFWPWYEFAPHSLNELRKIATPVSGASPIGGAFVPLLSSSHPVPEYGTDNYITFVTETNPLPFIQSSVGLVRIKSADNREVITRIPLTDVPYMHSFALSRNYAILFLCPLNFNMTKSLRSFTPLDSLDWHPDKPTQVAVINIHTGEHVMLQTEAVFVMHHVNSVERTGSVIDIDVVTYPDISVFKNLQFTNIRGPRPESDFPKPVLKRYTVDLQANTVEIRPFHSVGTVKYAPNLDMPAINENYRHSVQCYVYGIGVRDLFRAGLVRKDLCGGIDLAWHEENEYPAEPWFVARPGGHREDDGVLLSVVLDGTARKSFLGIYYARTMRRVNRCTLPQIVPFSLHGRFFPGV